MTSTARRATPAVPQAANDNRPSKRHALLAGEGAGLPARQAYNDSEKPGVHAQKARIAARTRHVKNDWDGAANDNEQSWPQATALVREGNADLLKYAMAYRRIYDQAKSEATLGGSGVSMREGFSLDQKTHIMPNGQIAYKGVRQSTAAAVDIPARQYVQPYPDEDSGVERNWSKVPKPWNGDKPVNDMIDAKRELARLQDKLGHLCEPFEMSCIDGATYQKVGNALGIANRAGALGAGNAAVHMALLTIRDNIRAPKPADLAV